MVMRILFWLGIAAGLTLVLSCFLPWIQVDGGHIPGGETQVFTGFYSFQNNYGKPGKLLTIIAAIFLLLSFLPKIWAKRTNLFVCALGVGYALKSYVLFTSCFYAYCPVKKPGIYLMVGCTIVMMLAAALPKMNIASEKKIDIEGEVQA